MIRRRRTVTNAAAALPRRQFLQLGAVAAGAGLLLPRCSLSSPPDTLPGCPLEPEKSFPAPTTDWLYGARVAGMELYLGASTCVMKEALDRLAEEHVSVVEVDAELSAYLTADDFKKQLDLLDQAARGAHLRGMRAVAYYPTLEVLTPDAEKTEHTMSKDHPDWLQKGMDGKLNVFVGGGGRVFWVDPGTESAWMCPTGGYVGYFTERVKGLCGTSLDGLWGDVPLLSDIVGIWPCVGDSCNARFKKETGLDAPTVVAWDDATFRRWIQWRHTMIWQFEQEILKAAKSARQDFEVIIETVTMDYTAGTVQGLDGASQDDGGIYRVWEVDAVSDATAMRGATADDWISMAVMMRYGRGAASPRPTWIFTYGLEEDDAEHVMALAIAGGCCPYETKIPLMNTSVGPNYRTRMYTWLERHPEIFRTESANAAAVLYSSVSRDFLDRASGVGLYTSMNSGDGLWWSTREQDSARDLQYVGDFRGCCKALVHAHVPFDIVTAAHLSGSTLSGYELVVAPSLVALSDQAAGQLDDFVKGGGTLVVTGTDGGQYDAQGALRAAPKIMELFGLSATAIGWTTVAHGSGQVIHAAGRVGRDYFGTDGVALLAEFVKAAKATGPQVTSTAPLAVVFDLRRTSTGALLLLCSNLDGLGSSGLGKYTGRDASFSVSLALSGKTAKKVTLSEPTAGAKDREVAFQHQGGAVTFEVAVHALMLATVELT
jgi:hypothetical protein